MDKFSKYYSEIGTFSKSKDTNAPYPKNQSPISGSSTPQELSDFVMLNVQKCVDTKIIKQPQQSQDTV